MSISTNKISPRFHQERGLIDLSSLMIGIIVVGILAGITSAIVFAVIPWSQDRATKQMLSTVVTAEESYAQAYDAYASKEALINSGLLKNSDQLANMCIVSGSLMNEGEEGNGNSFAAYAFSKTGKTFFVSKTEGKDATDPERLSAPAKDGTTVPSKVTSLDQISSWCTDSAIEAGAENVPAPTISFISDPSGKGSIPYDFSISALATCRYADDITYSARNTSTGAWSGTKTLPVGTAYNFKANDFWTLTGNNSYTYGVKATCNYYSRTSAPAEVNASSVKITNTVPANTFTSVTAAENAEVFTSQKVGWNATGCATGTTAQYQYVVSLTGKSGSYTSPWSSSVKEIALTASQFQTYIQPTQQTTIQVRARCSATNYNSTNAPTISRTYLIKLSPPGAATGVKYDAPSWVISWNSATNPTCATGSRLEYRFLFSKKNGANSTEATAWSSATSVNGFSLNFTQGTTQTGTVETRCNFNGTYSTSTQSAPLTFVTIVDPPSVARNVTLSNSGNAFTLSFGAPATLCSQSNAALQYRIRATQQNGSTVNTVVRDWNTSTANYTFTGNVGVAQTYAVDTRCLVNSMASATATTSTTKTVTPSTPTGAITASLNGNQLTYSANTLACEAGATLQYWGLQTANGSQPVSTTLYINSASPRTSTISWSYAGNSTVVTYAKCVGQASSSGYKSVNTVNRNYAVAMPTDIAAAWNSQSGLSKVGYATDQYIDTPIYRYQYFEKGAIAIMKNATAHAVFLNTSQDDALPVIAASYGTKFGASTTYKTSVDLTCGLKDNGCSIETNNPSQTTQVTKFYYTPSVGSYSVSNALLAQYKTLGQQDSTLGYPTSHEKSGTALWYNTFQNGDIGYTKSNGRTLVTDQKEAIPALDAKYKDIIARATGNTIGTADSATKCGLAQNGCVLQYTNNGFTRGIYWSPSTGAHVVQGGVREQWGSLGWENSQQGYPISDEIDNNDGFWYSKFEHGFVGQMKTGTNVKFNSTKADVQNDAIDDIAESYRGLAQNAGLNLQSTNATYFNLTKNGGWMGLKDSKGGSNIVIYWSPSTGAHWIMGGLFTSYSEENYENGWLGYPTSDQYAETAYWYNTFENGVIVYNKTGNVYKFNNTMKPALADIKTEMGSKGGQSDFVCGLTIRNGCWQSFSGGAVMWSPDTGAYTTLGGIRNLWQSTGFESGRLGYPSSNEVVSGNLVTQHYQNGYIVWNNSTASGTIYDGNSPRGFLDNVTVVTSGSNKQLKVRGWAWDPSVTNKTTEVHFYVTAPDGTVKIYSGNMANLARPDVNTVFGIKGDHGYELTLSNLLTQKGTYKVDAYAIGQDPYHKDNNPQIGSKTITVS